jgi:tetratricopeptide (TPR) repeat protein
MAARAWLNSDPALAVTLYDDILIDWPRDVLALAVAHALDFHLGHRRMMRDRIAKVLPNWTADMPGYASVLAMYAFALEENRQYRLAERIAKQALTLDPGHPGAIHVVAHVMEMQGRGVDGLAFLAALESAWGEGTGLSVHLAWHRALFHLDANDPEGALAIYDAQIATAGSADMSALADGSALLWRLQLQDIDVGERWRLLADRWATHNLADARPFYVVHATIAFIAAGRPASAMRLTQALPSTHGNEGSSLSPEDALAGPLCEPRAVRRDPPYVHRSRFTGAKSTPCPRVGGGAHRTETGEQTQSITTAASGAGRLSMASGTFSHGGRSTGEARTVPTPPIEAIGPERTLAG